MALQTGRRRRGQKRVPMNEINMTPFIDVMLVLLVIFMVTAPLMSGGVPLDLPKANSAPIQFDSKPLTVEINASGQVFINGDATTDADFPDKLKAAAGSSEEVVVVRGDKTLNYERVMQVVAAVNRAGFRKLSLLSEQSK
ncbi:MAG: ExbD/TolR family protein [Methylobacteriaceae bacterium]|nr:ExbD/TolR family protein [Methylobacteriaceae bacterium]